MAKFQDLDDFSSVTVFGAPHAPKLQDFSSITVSDVTQSYETL